MYQAAQDRYNTLPTRRCGNSGLLLPAVSLGLWHNFGDTAPYENMRALCRTAFDNGITHFDLANNYGPEPGAAERNFGRILHDDLGVYRDELIISTKAGYEMWDGPYGNWGSRKYLLASLDQSLRRMGLDYVDIFYHHRMDPNTPLEETMGALAQAVRSGKALYVGLSNYDGPTLEKATAILDELHVPFIINQNRYSIFDRTIENNGLKAMAARLHKGIITFSPLAQGLLTNRYLQGIPADSRVHTDGRFLKEKDITPEKIAQINALNDIAQARGQTLAEMALAWLVLYTCFRILKPHGVAERHFHWPQDATNFVYTQIRRLGLLVIPLIAVVTVAEHQPDSLAKDSLGLCIVLLGYALMMRMAETTGPRPRRSRPSAPTAPSSRSLSRSHRCSAAITHPGGGPGLKGSFPRASSTTRCWLRVGCGAATPRRSWPATAETSRGRCRSGTPTTRPNP